MAITPKSVTLTEDESYLVALIQDNSGIDLAELVWDDPMASNPERIFRAWDFQYSWWRDMSTYVIDQCARAVGKTLGIILRGWAFAIQHPGAEMVVTAPEAIHLAPLTARIEDRIKQHRLTRELLPPGVGRGFKHRPFQVDFRNGAKILGRIPQRDGRGVKGLHPLHLEMDECFPAGTLVLTKRGLIGIESVVVGDEVVTKENRWRPVIGTAIRERAVVRLEGEVGELVASENHPFWAIREEGGQPEWVAAKDMAGAYWATPTRYPEEQSPPSFANSRVFCDQTKDEFFWLIGYYLSEGVVSLHQVWLSTPVSEDKALYVKSKLDALFIRYTDSKWGRVRIDSVALSEYLATHCRIYIKSIPWWVFGLKREWRAQVLEGLTFRESAIIPRELVVGIRMLSATLEEGQGGMLFSRVESVEPEGDVETLYDLTIEEDESFIADGFAVHNSQDYPTSGWLELIETLRHGEEGAQWRAHGVSRGVHDEFYRHSQDDSLWSVHRKTGMHRPTWSDQERSDKIEAYGSRDSPDYKRNILGLHGDATNPLFVLHRLMKTVDDNQGSEYNQDIYYHLRLSDEKMVGGSPISHFIDFPGSHRQWTEIWAGMDVGLTAHPTEILIFGEENVKKRHSTEVALRLLSRLNLQRISAADQRRVVQMIFDFYKPRRFSVDRGGLGLPVYQDLHEEMPNEKGRIIGYTADQKIVVGWDPHESTEDPKDFEIRARVKEYGYDKLRQYVDSGRIILPWDQELLGEWQGSTWYRERSETNPYGKKAFNRGSFHALDAAAMMIVGKEMLLLDRMVEVRDTPEFVPMVWV